MTRIRALPFAIASLGSCGGGGASIPAPLSVIATPGTLAISSHAEGASNGRYEITFTGSCLTDGSALSVSAVNATILSSSCSSGALSITARYTGIMESAGTWYVIVSQGSSSGSRSVAHTNPCPTNYVFVPANSDVGSSHVCFGKWHVSGTTGSPTFTGGNLPLVNVTRAQASSVCTSLVPAQRLPSNAEWQAMARSIEADGRNWSGGARNSGIMNMGHAIDAGGTRASSNDDNDPCINTGSACSLTTWHSERRIHYLSTGSVIWDVGGNATNWVSDTYSLALTAQYVYLLGGSDRLTYGPTGTDYTAENDMGRFTIGAASTGMTRGAWDDATGAGGDAGGVFSARVADPTTANTARSFRCVADPSY